MTDFKVGIVGAQENKWPKLAILLVKDSIRLALTKEYYVCKECGYNFKWPHVVNHVEQGLVETFKPTVMVSGGCPYKGVDVWAEEIADELGIAKKIFKPEVNQWGNQAGNFWIPDKDECYERNWKMGYKERNMRIGRIVDVLYVYSPAKENAYCKHCGTLGHIGNGGCWTGKYAKGLLNSRYNSFPIKEVIRIVI